MDREIKISLRAARVNAGLTQEEVAKQMHKTKQTVVNWEAGTADIKYYDLLQLSQLYSMPLEYIRMPRIR